MKKKMAVSYWQFIKFALKFTLLLILEKEIQDMFMKKIVAMDVWTKDVTLSTLQKEGKNLWSYCHFYYAERKKLADYPIWKMLMQNVTVKSYFMNILGTKEVGIEFHPTEDKNRVLFYFNFSV